MTTSAPTSDASSWLDKVDPAVVSRGKDYVRRKLVKPVASHSATQGLAFEVQGTELYHVVLDPASPFLSECDCPHAANGALCKHVVAAWFTMLAPSADVSTPAPKAKPAPRKTPTKAVAVPSTGLVAEAELAAIRKFISERSNTSTALNAGRRLSAIEEDIPQSPKQWRSFVVHAMPPKQGMYGRELERWADNALDALQLLDEQLTQQPAMVRNATGIALLRLYKIWQTSDDSDGQVAELYGWLLDMVHKAVKAEPPPKSWLKDWIALMEADPVGNWNEEELLADAGPALRTAYAHWAIEEWNAWCKAHPLQASKSRRKSEEREPAWDLAYKRGILRSRFLWAMAQSQDVPTQLQTMQDCAVYADDWIGLIEFCRRNGLERQGLEFAQEAIKAFSNDHQIKTLVLGLYRQAGWDKQAMELAQQRLDGHPADEEHLQTVLDCAAALGTPVETAFAEQLERLLKRSVRLDRSMVARTEIDVALRWLLARNDWAKALELYERPDTVLLNSDLIQELALALPAVHSGNAIAMLESVLYAQMKGGTSPYKRELQIARLILKRVPQAGRRAWVDAAIARYPQRKRYVEGLEAMIT